MLYSQLEDQQVASQTKSFVSQMASSLSLFFLALLTFRPDKYSKINLKTHVLALKQTLVCHVQSGWHTNVPNQPQPIPCFSSPWFDRLILVMNQHVRCSLFFCHNEDSFNNKKELNNLRHMQRYNPTLQRCLELMKLSLNVSSTSFGGCGWC